MVLRIFFSFAFGYLLGSVCSAYLIAKLVKGVATSGGAVLYLAPKLFPLVLLLYFFVQRKGPRSAPLLLLAIVVFFVFLIFLYPHCYLWLVPAVLFLIGIGVLANVSALKEMRR